MFKDGYVDTGMPVVQTILLKEPEVPLLLKMVGIGSRSHSCCSSSADYIHIGWPTLKWRRICSRGESQAIKISTGFSNITNSLAHAGYYVGSLAQPSVSFWRFVYNNCTEFFYFRNSLIA